VTTTEVVPNLGRGTRSVGAIGLALALSLLGLTAVLWLFSPVHLDLPLVGIGILVGAALSFALLLIGRSGIFSARHASSQARQTFPTGASR